MSHFAKIDNNNIVTEVIKSEFNFIGSGSVGDVFEWIQTSYNGNFRKNFAGVGYTYDKTLDAFIEPKPYLSWILDESTCKYVPPIPSPSNTEKYKWEETSQTWVSSNV